MESSFNNDAKKCRHCQGNRSACDCLLVKDSVARPDSSQNGSTSSNNKSLSKVRETSCEKKKVGGWRSKLNLFCHNKPEKKKDLSETFVDQKNPGKSGEGKEREDYSSVSNNLKQAALKELFPQLKEITKASGAVLNTRLLEQRLELLKKSYTLPTQLNGDQRSRNIFKNQMEVLTSNESDTREVTPLNLNNIMMHTNGDLHSKTKEVKHGIVVPQVTVSKQNSPRSMISVCPNHCGKTGGEVLEAVLYCGVCAQTMCYKCAFEKHKEHKVTPIQTAAETVRTSNEELQQRIHAQFEQVVQRLRKKEDDVMEEVEKMKLKRVNLILGLQNQQETAWGQIDAVLKTEDDGKMLEEYNGLSVIEFNIPDNVACTSFSPMESGSHLLWKRDGPRTQVDLNRVQDEIEKICLAGPDLESSIDGCEGSVANGMTPRQSNKRFAFKLDVNTAHSALRVSANHTSVEYVGSERNGVNTKHSNAAISSISTGHPYNSKYPRIPNGLTSKLKRTQFATVLGDSSITQGKQYWEVSVNRSMEYRLGVAYKHMQGTKTLADEHNCWALCLTYPDRFSAIHKHHKDYIFIPTHNAVQTSKVIRIGIFLDYERGVLSFYNASTAAEKKHLYTFRTFFNRPVWPLLSLRQGKLQVLAGLPVPRNLVWKTR